MTNTTTNNQPGNRPFGLPPALRYTPTHSRKIQCLDCGQRRPMSAEMMRSDMCAACLEWSECENSHSDYGHDGTDADCPVCQGHTHQTYVASFYAGRSTRTIAPGRTQSASTADKDGTAECQVCHVTKPLKKFPTKKVGAEYVRDATVCRQCRS